MWKRWAPRDSVSTTSTENITLGDHSKENLRTDKNPYIYHFLPTHVFVPIYLQWFPLIVKPRSFDGDVFQAVHVDRFNWHGPVLLAHGYSLIIVWKSRWITWKRNQNATGLSMPLSFSAAPSYLVPGTWYYALQSARLFVLSTMEVYLGLQRYT